MELLNRLVQKAAHTDLPEIFDTVGLTGIDPINHEDLQEVTLAQWLLESGRATSLLSNEALNFSGLKWRSEMEGFATPLEIQVPSEPFPVKFCKFVSIDAFVIGYWKFLTRSPYQGLEEHTNNPANFIGFLQRKGFAADLNYVTKVLSLLPEARSLLNSARGVSPPPALNQLQVTSFPQEVEVGQSFIIEGTAPQSEQGKTLLITVDGVFPSQGALIRPNGQWTLNFVLHQAGDRHMRLTLAPHTQEFSIKAVLPRDHDDDEETPHPQGSIEIPLTGSVGSGGVNRPDDIKLIKKRLFDLGYTWVGDPESASLNTGFIQAIRVFQSIIAGRSTVAGDGRVDLGGPTHRWLQAANAPGWRTMPDSDPSVNFVNFEQQQTNDNHDFGTSWMADTISAIAHDYHAARPDAAPFAINNVSLPMGGDTPTHAGHETGLMCDILLLRQDGDFGGITWANANFDRAATRTLLRVIRRQKLVRAVFFNDPTLMSEQINGIPLCSFAGGHDNHIHMEINPPTRE